MSATITSAVASSKINSFTDLIAWKKAHQLVLDIYRLTKSFPSQEAFGLTNQIRRASISISSNIAEGFSRKSRKEKIQFYHMAISSLTEVQNQILIAKDVGYISKNDFELLANKTVEVSKLINSLSRTAQSKMPHT